MDIQNISNHSPFIYKPKQEIHDKQVTKPRPLERKNRAKTPPPGQLFSKIQHKNTRHETEIMKNSTEMLICLEILKQWKI